MKLYTRTGDDGSTGLFGGKRVSKNSLRIEAIGTVDETNSAIGLARAGSNYPAITNPLIQIQDRLFEIGADLATPLDAHASNLIRLEESRIAEIETMIDQAVERLPEMKFFILPGGGELAARLHLARSISRRAERAVITLAAEDQITPAIPVYLNRLSDLLFALARRANHNEGLDDVPWMGRKA
jgi:cob(I)alamin adenosyltransferase